MNLIVNGKQHKHSGNGSLVELLSEIEANPEQVAIMINNEVIRKADKDTTTLHDGDQIEIVTYAAGG